LQLGFFSCELVADMGIPNWARRVGIPCICSGEAHEVIKAWKRSKPKNWLY
jgi:predicted DNA-binding protein (UPF0278 family)